MLESFLFVSLLVEAIVEFIVDVLTKPVKENIPFITGIISGTLLSWVIGLDLFALAGIEIAVSGVAAIFVVSLASGFALARGGKFIHDLLGAVRGLSTSSRGFTD